MRAIVSPQCALINDRIAGRFRGGLERSDGDSKRGRDTSLPLDKKQVEEISEGMDWRKDGRSMISQNLLNSPYLPSLLAVEPIVPSYFAHHHHHRACINWITFTIKNTDPFSTAALPLRLAFLFLFAAGLYDDPKISGILPVPLWGVHPWKTY